MKVVEIRSLEPAAVLTEVEKLRAVIDYGFAEAHTMMGHIGVKVWLYKGDVGEEITEENAPEVPERGRGRR